MMTKTQANTTPETASVEPLRFERETCSRCGGSGHYSYCQSHGTVCFKCGGRKEVLTKRGYAASQYLNDLRSSPARDLKPGDQIRYSSITMGGTPFDAWYTIQEIGLDTSSYRVYVNGEWLPGRTDLLRLELTSHKAGPLTALGVDPEKMIRVALSPEEQRATLEQAIAYQATLTKAGTPRKRAGSTV